MSLEDDYKQLTTEDTMPTRALFRTEDVHKVLDGITIVRELHAPVGDLTHINSEWVGVCLECGRNWPCRTIQAVNGTES